MTRPQRRSQRAARDKSSAPQPPDLEFLRSVDSDTPDPEELRMFVFKAGVVGAGTMGAEIAQLIAAAGIPVVLRDVEQRLVDVGRQRVEELTAGQLDALVSKERLTRAQADEQLARTLALISTTTSYDGFGDV